MTKSTKYLILTLGILSIFSGIYMAVSGSDLIEVIFAFFAGISLIVGVLYIDKNPNSEADL